MAARTICVTGGAGFIGSHVAEAFVVRGHRVLVIDDLERGRREHVPAGAELHVLDVRSSAAAELVRTAGVEVLVHHAAQVDPRRSAEAPSLDAAVNVLGTLTLVEAGCQGALEQVVFASSVAVYGEQETFPADESHPTRPLSPYGVSKLAAEGYLRCFHLQRGLSVTCLRYANVYGPRQRADGEAGVVAVFAEKLLRGEPAVVHGDGLQTRDFVFVGDVVAANLAAVGRPGFEILNVGSGVESTVLELYTLLSAACGVDRPAVHRAAMRGEARRSLVSRAAAARSLGLPPPTPLAVGLGLTVDALRARPAAKP